MRLHQAGDLKRARITYEDLARANPDDPQPERLLAELDVREGLLVSARRRLEALAHKHPATREVDTALAGVAEELGDSATAVEIYSRERQNRAGDAHAQLRLATALRSAGRFGEAAAVCKRFIATWPNAAAGYVGLIAIDPAALSNDENSRACATSPKNRFERGRAYPSPASRSAMSTTAAATTTHAFDAYARRRGAARGGPVDAGARPQHAIPDVGDGYVQIARSKAESAQLASLVAHAQRIHRVPTAGTAATDHKSPAPIFIVGMPRSGSTLLEQILASHPNVHGLGETLAFPQRLGAQVAGRERHSLRQLRAPVLRRVGETYLDCPQGTRLDAAKAASSTSFSATSSTSPASISHCRARRSCTVMRDPVDTCFSCFRHLFRDRNETTYDLARRWAATTSPIVRSCPTGIEVLPGRVIHVRHEDLLADPEGQIRKLDRRLRSAVERRLPAVPRKRARRTNLQRRPSAHARCSPRPCTAGNHMSAI